MTNRELFRGYDGASRAVGLLDRSDRARIEVGGPDRAKVLHNLTTNDIKRLRPGEGREAFLTNGQGRTVGFLSIHAEEDRLLVRSDPGTAEAVLAHLSKYGLFEAAGFVDVSPSTTEWHLVGPSIDIAARRLGIEPPEADLGIVAGVVAGSPIRLIREGPAGRPGLTLIAGGDASRLPSTLREVVAQLGGEAIDPAAFESLRIEAGTPVFGPDITAANLPQEVNRDARAISFVKGCYLGQETVARLDALGHVNKILVSATAEDGRAPLPGSVLRSDGKDVGLVTSSAPSSVSGRAVVLGYVKVAFAEPGRVLTAESGDESIPLTVGGALRRPGGP